MNFLKNVFTNMHSLRYTVYNCMVCVIRMVKRGAQKKENLHCISFFRIVVLQHWSVKCKQDHHGICSESTFIKQEKMDHRNGLAMRFYRLVWW